MEISIVDYGVGNLFSIAKGFERAGANANVVSDPRQLLGAECIVFPGVGAFGAAMEVLRPVAKGLRDRILNGTPTLGVCLGMQIMFESSEESKGSGLGLFTGEVTRLAATRIPQMGWNEVVNLGDELFAGIPSPAQFYFANSYVCSPAEDAVVATSDYEGSFAAAVRKGNLCGVQFHPEKSGPAGLRLLRNFVRMAEERA